MKTFLAIQLVVSLIFGNFKAFHVNNEEHEVSPPYAKWGQIAIQETKKKYPQASIIDYLHIGKETGTDSSTEKFKLWLRENNKEFGVFVDISFDNETEEVINIKLTETSN